MRWIVMWVLGAWASAAQAADAPAWPDRAVLLVSTSVKLYDEPATTEAELTRRLGLYRLDLRWPAAPGAVRYRVRRDGADVATVTTTEWGADVKGAATYAVEAGDAAGRWSAPLTARVAHEDLIVTETAVLGSMPGGEISGIWGAPAGREPLNNAFGGEGPAGVVGFGHRGSAPPGGLGAADLSKDLLTARVGEPEVSGGLAAAAVLPMVKARGRALAYCVNRATAAEGTRARLKLAFATDGAATEVEATVEPENAAVAECLRKQVMRWRAPPAEDTTSVVVPVTFEKR